jgi:glycosyltransferase involved in cell wall biosynthesis
MDVVVALDFRFQQTPDGSVWTPTAYSYNFWKRYLEVFDRVKIVARAGQVPTVGSGDQQVTGEGVSFSPVPFYRGPLEYMLQARRVKQAVRRAVGRREAVILRVGSHLATCILPALWYRGHPYGLEVVGDPYEAFAPGAVRHPLRPFFRWHATRAQKRQCARACGAAYVTESALQRRYPCPAYSTGISDVELGEDSWADGRDERREQREQRLIFVGSLEQMYKAPDVLLEALALCVRAGAALSLRLIGEGRHLPELQRQAAALGLSRHVRFLGGLPAGAAVREELDQASLFVLPSRTEGLPRAMLEAMARGLPCIGSAVGGIPELLPPEDLVPPGDRTALAQKILEVIWDPRRMSRMSSRNLQKAGQYREDILRPRRVAFYRHVAQVTEKWIEAQAGYSQLPVLS